MLRLLLSVFLLCSPCAAQTWDVSIETEDVLVDPFATASAITMSIVGDTPGIGLGAWQFFWVHDTSLGVLSITPQTLTSPSFFMSYIEPGQGGAVCLYDFSLVQSLNTDTLVPFLALSVFAEGTAVPGSLATFSLVSNQTTLPITAIQRCEVTYRDATGTALPYEIPTPQNSTLLFVEFPTFQRGDTNQNGQISLTDIIFNLEVAFAIPSGPILCFAALDFNADGTWEPIIDVLAQLNWMFAGGPPSPGGVTCTQQDDLGLTCDNSVCP
jgi:hypothetical protein